MTSLTIVRRIAARPSIVFDALTTPEGIACWWGPDAGPVLLAETDARVGGRFRVRFRMLDFMYGPEWEEGCPGCSLLSDQVDGARQHFEHNDVSFVAVSRGPIEKLQAYRQRMGWKFRWVSSAASDFNFDYHVSFLEGTRERGR